MKVAYCASERSGWKREGKSKKTASMYGNSSSARRRIRARSPAGSYQMLSAYSLKIRLKRTLVKGGFESIATAARHVASATERW